MHKNVNCFINLHEFVYTPGIFEALLFLSKEEQEQLGKLDDDSLVLSHLMN